MLSVLLDQSEITFDYFFNYYWLLIKTLYMEI